MEQDYEIDDEIPCRACDSLVTYFQRCDSCDSGTRELADSPDEWGEDSFSEVNRLISCRDCHGTGIYRWCPKCGADCWRTPAKKQAAATPREGGGK